mmetsp:Transcript_54180/g.150319  ORF Transcript_54180/g.150319 Transcript_54180/m.150319 type:complete len:245 (-) Transcript_54180:107-841(-)|eukprot:CAMPEP_0179064018 /NCGR_PEP_ID=MMETSP0796-20121207/27734_1 /TAXON_ID=73915 /ORGANISM="Pyrodinium bahamense, Strain pbaha01" /LENGTH=244 /DNA_ID=CAMNT_0020760957 /DNA_START=47 /DNA_END=781 /DNA_ORIENTATION=+
MAEPSERVYISGLPSDMTNEKLKDILEAYGTIKNVKVMSGGAAIITFATLDEAKWIVDNLDGNMPEGLTQPINTKYANTSGGRGGWGKSEGSGWAGGKSGPYGGGCKGGGGWDKGGWGKGGCSIQMLKQSLVMMGVLPGGRSSKERSDAQQLYIKGLPSDTTDGDLHDIFGPFGAIPAKGVKAVLSPEGTCTGVGWVDFVDEEAAAKAAQALNWCMLPDGTTLRVHVKNSNWGNSKDKKDKAES